jgi:Subtilase family
MERDELAAAFYGEDPVPTPWATDCPVRFDAWLALANASGQGRRVDLILSINEEHGIRRVLDHFIALGMYECQPIAAGSFVAARLSLEDLIKAVLPMTSMAGLVRLAQEVGPPGILAALAGDFEAPPQSADPTESIERRQERSRHFMWFLRVLKAVASGGTRKRGRKQATQPDLDNQIVGYLLNAVAERSLTQPPGGPGQLIVDRRRRYPIVSVTSNREARSAVTRSRTTIKADAAEQLFSVDCSTIGWAVVDSGIEAEHPAFRDWDLLLPVPSTRVVRAFNFVGARETLSADALENGLIDWTRALPYLEIQLATPEPVPQNRLVPYAPPGDPHGTHVAGIIGGSWPDRGFRGICPNIRLYDFRVLDDKGKGDEFSIVAALQAIRYINEQTGRFVIAGANVSLSVPHDVATHSCGWTPVCVECDRLARSGVVVVSAAGNAGFSGVMRTLGSDYHTVSISDPGNTDSAITVGATHRSDPHRHGVSYFSSRGPTADGRRKPDLLAPGEDIDGPVPGGGISAMHGTSQAAAHVSGAAAMLVARYRELLGRSDRVKAILCETATDLGRERDFQGSGLVDVLRAMQSI